MDKILLILLSSFLVNGLYAQAFEEVKKKAEQGDQYAQFRLGEYYEKGIVIPQDKKQAFYWYTKSAKQNHNSARFSLGEMYYHGDGVATNRAKTFQLYKKGAESTYFDGMRMQYRLGLMYFKGIGCIPNKEKGVNLLNKIKNKYKPAQYAWYELELHKP